MVNSTVRSQVPAGGRKYVRDNNGKFASTPGGGSSGKISAADAAFISAGKTGTLPSQRAARKSKKKSGGSKGKGKSGSGKKSGGSARKATAPKKISSSRASKAATARKTAYAKAQHGKQVHKAVVAKRAVLAAEKNANAAGATPAQKLAAIKRRQKFTQANAAFDATRGKTNALKSPVHKVAATTRHKPKVAAPVKGPNKFTKPIGFAFKKH
jgi:hypothetical protein